MQIIQNYNYKSYNLFGSFNANKKFSKSWVQGEQEFCRCYVMGKNPQLVKLLKTNMIIQ